MKPIGLFIVFALVVLSTALAADMTARPEGSAFKVLQVERIACGAASCLRFTIFCKRNFYHGRIDGLLLRATWYAPDGSREKTTVNHDGSCALGGDITQTLLVVPHPGTGFTVSIDPVYK